jgi:hypothetical protein
MREERTKHNGRTTAAMDKMLAATKTATEAFQRGDDPNRIRSYVEDVTKWSQLVNEDLADQNNHALEFDASSVTPIGARKTQSAA